MITMASAMPVITTTTTMACLTPPIIARSSLIQARQTMITMEPGTPAIADDDNDGVPDTTDNCPFTANPSQSDIDHDGIGSSCDSDNDNDGVPNATDNCPLTPNPDQRDTNGDGVGDACSQFQLPQGGVFVIGDQGESGRTARRSTSGARNGRRTTR